MANVQEIGPYSAYAIAVKYGYQGTEEEWVQEQEANRKAAEAAAAAAAQSAKDAAATASNVAQTGQQAVQNIQNAQTTALQAIDTAKQQAVQAAQAEAEKAATSAGRAAASAAEAAQSATNAAAEVGKVQSAGTSAVQSVQAAQNTATEAVSDAQQTATQAVSQAQTAAVSAVQEAGTTQTSAVESAGTAAVSAVSNAKTEALSQISTAGPAQVSAVEAAGADAVEDVNDAKTAALEEIEDANAALPNPTQSDAGKVPVVNAEGTGYELGSPQGETGATPQLTIGSVTTLEPGEDASVSISGTVEAPVLNFSIPQGMEGQSIHGSYVGTGTYGADNPNTLEFGRKINFLAISVVNNGMAYGYLIFIRGTPYAIGMALKSLSTFDLVPFFSHVIWQETSVMWYADMINAVYAQANVQGCTYNYVAF